MWVTKLLISPVKKRIFCPKTTKFGPILAILVNLGQAMQAYSVPCWWVGWLLWRAGCISQDTYLLYYSYDIEHIETKTVFGLYLINCRSNQACKSAAAVLDVFSRSSFCTIPALASVCSARDRQNSPSSPDLTFSSFLP